MERRLLARPSSGKPGALDSVEKLVCGEENAFVI
jgi:hypothetical protein